jgi:uncharacterized membrane protein
MVTLNPTVSEWLNLIFRWVHVFAGIMWVGTTYYFTWLDARLSEEEKAAGAAGEPAQIWMVHSGGFYVVEKRKVPDILSRTLHWFRWEAATTWLSGLALLMLMFYIGGGSGLLEGNAGDISGRTAVAVGVGLLVVGWVAYDLMMISPLGRNEKAFAVIAYILIVGLAYGLTQVLSGRAAYIHMGAMFGTIMAANVWMRILPAQKKMIAAIKESRQPDQALAAQAKLRSKQNTFMAVPVVFLMISNHFPSTYGDLVISNFQLPRWSVLAALILLGWIAAKFIRRA